MWSMFVPSFFSTHLPFCRPNFGSKGNSDDFLSWTQLMKIWIDRFVRRQNTKEIIAVAKVFRCTQVSTIVLCSCQQWQCQGWVPFIRTTDWNALIKPILWNEINVSNFIWNSQDWDNKLIKANWIGKQLND